MGATNAEDKLIHILLLQIGWRLVQGNPVLEVMAIEEKMRIVYRIRTKFNLIGTVKMTKIIWKDRETSKTMVASLHRTQAKLSN